MAIANPFVWGRGGAALTPAEIAKRRQIEDAILAQGVDTSPVQHWAQGLSRVANAAAGAYRRNSLDDSAAKTSALGSEGFNKIVNALRGQSGDTSAVPMTDAAAEVSATAPTSGQPIDMTGNEVYDQFMGTVKEGVTNPYALAAVAATAKAESGFDPGNVNRTWSDPSESGQAGTAGGVMSWRGPRYEALAATGDLSPAGQARFFLGEDPTLIEKLNSAKSVEEAQSLMNGAWKFAGYDRPGGEAANRLSAARSFLPTFQGGGEVASLDPSAAIEAVAPIDAALPVEGASLADEASDFRQTPEFAERYPYLNQGETAPLADQQFDERFGQTPLPAEQLTGQDAIVQALIEQKRGAGTGQQAIATQTAGIPATGQAAQTDGFMQAVNGTNTGGTFGLNPMQQQATQQYAQANLLEDPAFLEAMNNPYMTDQQRAIAQTMVEQRMKQQAMEREYRMKQADPSYQLGLKKTRLEIENMENPRETPSDKLARERFDYERGTADRTNDIKNYEYYAQREAAAGRQPLGPLEWESAQRKASAASTNVTVGEGDKFYENLDKKNAETFATLSEGGMGARARAAQLDQLEALLQQSPSGAEAGVKLWLGDWGVNSDGLNGIQATRALIEKMVPEQRQPGSGPMSDADIAMYRRSLPTVLNQPGGNSLVIGTAKAIAQYDMHMGEIADAVADREISPAEGRRRIRELENPLVGYTKRMRDMGINKLSEDGAGTKTKTGRSWKVVE